MDETLREERQVWFPVLVRLSAAVMERGGVAGVQEARSMAVGEKVGQTKRGSEAAEEAMSVAGSEKEIVGPNR
jgi:hypothetical protein